MKAVEQYCSMYENCDAKSLDSYKQYFVKHHKPQTINLRIRSVTCMPRHSSINEQTLLPLPTFSDTKASRPHKSTCEDLALNRNALSTRL